MNDLTLFFSRIAAMRDVVLSDPVPIPLERSRGDGAPADPVPIPLERGCDLGAWIPDVTPSAKLVSDEGALLSNLTCRVP